MFQNAKQKRLLFSPLEWGLGHATRSVALLRYFESKGWQISIACDQNGSVFTILSQYFPDAKFIHLSAIRIQYSKDKAHFNRKMVLQFPKLFFSIVRDHQWLQRHLRTTHYDLVLSDNRYGFYSSHLPSLFMTHQLYIDTPSFTSIWVQKLNYFFINRFQACLVPDLEASPNIAGLISHPATLPKVPTFYIGPLCRFGKRQFSDPLFKLLLLVSGPEPQRTILENLLLKIVENLPFEILLVRGLPNAETPMVSVSSHIKIFNHLPDEEMRKAIASSQFVVCRSGYTSIMELLSWQKKIICIPTPGQTEQENVAKHLQAQHWAYVIPQSDALQMRKALLEALAFDFKIVEWESQLDRVLPKVLDSISVTS